MTVGELASHKRLILLVRCIKCEEEKKKNGKVRTRLVGDDSSQKVDTGHVVSNRSTISTWKNFLLFLFNRSFAKLFFDRHQKATAPHKVNAPDQDLVLGNASQMHGAHPSPKRPLRRSLLYLHRSTEIIVRHKVLYRYAGRS
jgi:hypothetical protein